MTRRRYTRREPPPAPVVPAPRSNPFKSGFLAVLGGVFALVLIAVIGSFFVSRDDGADAPSGVLALRQPAKVGDWQLSVISVTTDERLGERKAQGLFLGVGLGATNVGKDNHALDPAQFVVRDGAGNTYHWNEAVSRALPVDPPDRLVGPGLATATMLVFDVSSDAKALHLFGPDGFTVKLGDAAAVP